MFGPSWKRTRGVWNVTETVLVTTEQEAERNRNQGPGMTFKSPLLVTYFCHWGPCLLKIPQLPETATAAGNEPVGTFQIQTICGTLT